MTDFKSIRTATEMDLLVAFFDLSSFTRATRGYSRQDIFNLLSEYYEFVGDIVEEGGGMVVKFMGDGAILVFPEDRLEDGVIALKALKDQGDAWLTERGVHARHIVKAHFGPVTCGPVGTRTDKHFDLFFETVNIAATLPSNGLAISPQVFRKLTPETRKRFKKHTPPITYIPTEEPHRD